VTVSGRDETERLIAQLHRAGSRRWTFPENEMAKLHVRHLVGGHAPEKQAKMVYRFEFPERPGALMNFLKRMGSGWNISALPLPQPRRDVGRVLVGLQVPDKDRAAFRRFLRDLGYDYADETRNPAYRLFLK